MLIEVIKLTGGDLPVFEQDAAFALYGGLLQAGLHIRRADIVNVGQIAAGIGNIANTLNRDMDGRMLGDVLDPDDHAGLAFGRLLGIFGWDYPVGIPAGFDDCVDVGASRGG